MPIDFPFAPTVGQVYYYSNKSWTYNGTAWDISGFLGDLSVDYLVIAGGGGGGNCGGFVGAGGGGAGGYRTSFGTSGGNSAAESFIRVGSGVNYTVTVGAGGAMNTNGSDSRFHTTLSYGGCKGGNTAAINQQPGVGGSGGGGQGATYSAIVGFGIPLQGVNGSSGYVNTGMNQGGGGGGGGASATGGATSLAGGGTGGNGLASTITGTSVTRAGGGGGGAGNTASFAAGGTGGGGNGGANTGGAATAGTVNTGGGGGGGNNTGGSVNGAAGGSGVVILRYPDIYTLTIGAGLTGSTAAASGGFKVTTFTAGTGSVSWTA